MQMERRVGDRQRNPSSRSQEPVDEHGKTTQETMGDRTTNDHHHTTPAHRSSAVRQKKDQIQWHRIRSNKVGVDEGGAAAVSMDVVREVEERGGSQSPAPCSLSAKLRSGSGSSQFREVDFSDQVQGVGSASLERPRYFVGDSSFRHGGGPGGPLTGRDDKENTDEAGKRDNVRRGNDNDDDEDDANQQELRVLKNGDEVGRITVFKGNVQVNDGSNGSQDNRMSDGKDGVVIREGAVRIGLDGSIEIGGGGIGEDEFDERSWGTGGNLVRRVVQVPQSLVLKDDPKKSDDPLRSNDPRRRRSEDDPRFSSGASTSHVCIPHYQASTDSFTTGATELSSGSTRGGTTTTAAEGDEETPKTTRPPIPPQDEQEKPTLTPTSLAIYSSIQQQGSSRSGTCVLFTTAVCTFIVTLVLTVAILIAPKTLASRGEDQAARAAPALTTTTNTSDTPASHAALHAQTLTRVLSSVRAPTSPTPTTSSIPTTSAASSTPTILQDSQNTTELFKDALRTR